VFREEMKMRAARVLSSLAVSVGLLLASGALSTCLAQAAASPAGPSDSPRVLTNGDVVQMLKSGFSDAAAIAVIQKAKTRFDLSSAALAELRYAGVSDSVIVAMLESGNAPANAPAPKEPAVPPAPSPVPAASPTPAAAPQPATPPAPPPVWTHDGETPRGGGVFSLALGGNYAFFVDQGFSNDSSRFGGALGLQAGGHVGKHVLILADVHASLWPETDDYQSAALFSLGPALRVSPVPHLSFEIGASFALAVPDWDQDPWLGPDGHLGLGIELTSGHSRFALELWGRLDLAYLQKYNCDNCDSVTLGRAITQLAFTWY
jgi:hypothetical protein